MQMLKLKSKYDQRHSLQETHRNDSHRYKNEIINNEGMSNNAKLILSILSLKFNDNDLHQNLYIKIVYKNEFKKTASLSNRKNIIWNESFEFRVESQKDKVILEVCQLVSNKEIVTGTINIPIDRAENQDEYECEIEIPEVKNGKPTGNMSEIKLKMQFIKSFYTFYVDSALKIELEKNEIMSNIITIQKTFEQLNGTIILHSFSSI